jgi:uncharacterized membrane protein
LKSSLPAGWTTGFSLSSLTLSPGQTATATMTKNIPAGIAPGTYQVDATAWNANHSTTALASAGVTTPPIAVVVTAVPASVKARDNVTIEARVSNMNGAVSGATVTFTVSRPNGPVTQVATTNSSGIATWIFKAQQKGNYSVMATASSNGVSATSNTVAFTAQ